MNVIRRAAPNGEMDTMPVDLRMRTEEGRLEMDPPYRDYQYFWRPNLNSPTLFWYVTENMEEEIYRYPAVLYTDEFFQETENESGQTDTSLDYNMDSGEWFGVLDPIDVVRFWEATDDNSPVNTDTEVSKDESSDEDWRRPPPINTSGLEWYYE